MNSIKEIKISTNNWIEVTWVDGNNKEIHCESFGDSDEYIDLLNQRCIELEVQLSKDDLSILAEQKSKRKVFTEEELAEIARLAEEQRIAGITAEAQLYLNSTDFYYPRFLETGDPVPEEVVMKRTEARDFIRLNKVAV